MPLIVVVVALSIFFLLLFNLFLLLLLVGKSLVDSLRRLLIFPYLVFSNTFFFLVLLLFLLLLHNQHFVPTSNHVVHFLAALDNYLLDVALYLRGKQVSQLHVQLMLLSELLRQVVGVIPLENLDVLLLTPADVDCDR